MLRRRFNSLVPTVRTPDCSARDLVAIFSEQCQAHSPTVRGKTLSVTGGNINVFIREEFKTQKIQTISKFEKRE
jgi:hypothetical protein